MYISDRRICELIQQHDPRGFKMLLESYYRPLVLWADTIIKNLPAAEDIVQEFVVNMWENCIVDRITPHKLRGYLFTSVKNLSLKHIAKNDPLNNPDKLSNLVLDSLDPEDITEEMLRDIVEEIKKLPPRMREVLKAVYIDGMLYKDVAARFSISIGTVKSLVARALQRLREVFALRKWFY